MIAQDGIVEPSDIGWWSEALEELHVRIAHRFACSEARGRVQRYLSFRFNKTMQGSVFTAIVCHSILPGSAQNA